MPNTTNTFLATEKEYGDFELELDFKIDDPTLTRASRFAATPGRKAMASACTATKSRSIREVIAVGRRASTLKEAANRREAGWLNDLSKNAAAREAFKLGQWNHLRIVANGRHIQTWLNGVPAADFTDTDDEAFTPSGFIALQVHEVGEAKEPKEVRWRNIKLDGARERHQRGGAIAAAFPSVSVACYHATRPNRRTIG